MKNRSIFLLVTILLILITFSLHNILLLLGEKQCWSLSGLKGLTWEDRYCLQPQPGMGLILVLQANRCLLFWPYYRTRFILVEVLKSVMPLNIEKAEQFPFICTIVSGKFLV